MLFPIVVPLGSEPGEFFRGVPATHPRSIVLFIELYIECIKNERTKTRRNRDQEKLFLLYPISGARSISIGATIQATITGNFKLLYSCSRPPRVNLPYPILNDVEAIRVVYSSLESWQDIRKRVMPV